jgi:hypothetical protein
MARRYADPSMLPVSAPSKPFPIGRGGHTLIAALAIGSATVLMVHRLWRRTELIAPIGPDIQAMAIFVGTFAGTCLIGAIAMRALDGARGGENRATRRGLVDAVAAAGLLIVAATWCARSLVECYAFAGGPITTFPATFDVVGGENLGRGNRAVRVRFGASGRILSVPSTWAAYDAARPGETVTLPVETGRRGIQRAMLPARALTRDDLHGA